MQFRLADRISLGIGCIIMAIVYFVVHGSYGIDLFHQGHTEAYAWRVYQGQQAYFDFPYALPPLSIYLHSLFSGISTSVYWERFIFYLLISLSVLFSTRSLQAFFDFRTLGVSPLIFSFISFVFSVHNFPPSAASSIDGIFFASLGFYLFTKTPHGFIYGLTGLISFLFAGLCHQIFWPLIICAPIMLYGLYSGKKSNWAISLFVSLLVLTLIALLLFAPDFTSQAWNSIHFLTGKELWELGIKPYGKPLLVIVGPLTILWLIKMNYTLLGFWKDIPALVFWIFFFGMLGAHVAQAMKTGAYVAPSFGFGQALFLIAIGVNIRKTWLEPKASLLVFGMLLLSWCVSLDSNYPHHFLYISPILFCFFRGLHEELDFRLPRYFYGTAFFVIYWMFAVLYQYPNGDATRSRDIYNMGEIYPRLSGVLSGEKVHQQAKEMEILRQDYPQSLVIASSFPMFDMLHDSLPTALFDDLRYPIQNQYWPRDVIKKHLEENCRYILLEKDSTRLNISPENLWLIEYIKTQWEQIEDGDLVDIYSLEP